MTLNQVLDLSYPEGFHILDEAERSKLQFIADGPGEVLSDPDRHITMSFGWNTLNGFTALLIGTHDVAMKMKTAIASSSAPYGYKEEQDLKRPLGGQTAEGIRFTYTAQDVPMTGESYVVKYKKTLYYFHYYTRTALWETNKPVWDSILDSVSWK